MTLGEIPLRWFGHLAIAFVLVTWLHHGPPEPEPVTARVQMEAPSVEMTCVPGRSA